MMSVTSARNCQYKLCNIFLNDVVIWLWNFLIMQSYFFIAYAMLNDFESDKSRENYAHALLFFDVIACKYFTLRKIGL